MPQRSLTASLQANVRILAKFILPPILVHAYRRLCPVMSPPAPKKGIYLAGEYVAWSAAQADSTGYDAGIILEKTRDALLKVKAGEAVYERDSVLFDEIHYSWPVLAALLWVAAQHEGCLNVLDFGGSLGSTYFQNRHFLLQLPNVRWNIVEQAQQVETGKRYFEDEHLHFYRSVDACLAVTQPQVILLGSVLQYMEYPYELLAELAATPCTHLIIDRTPFSSDSRDRLCMQHVPSTIYPASYPGWIFAAQRFKAILSLHWEIVAEFDNPDRLPGPIPFAYRGLIARRHGQEA